MLWSVNKLIICVTCAFLIPFPSFVILLQLSGCFQRIFTYRTEIELCRWIATSDKYYTIYSYVCSGWKSFSKHPLLGWGWMGRGIVGGVQPPCVTTNKLCGRSFSWIWWWEFSQGVFMMFDVWHEHKEAHRAGSRTPLWPICHLLGRPTAFQGPLNTLRTLVRPMYRIFLNNASSFCMERPPA